MQTATWEDAEPSRWYVAYTAPRREIEARDHLVRQSYEAYLPLVGRMEPMFPRYLFFRPSSPEQSIAPVRSTRGVQSVLRFGGLYAVVTDELVQAVRQQETLQQSKQSTLAPSPKAGQRVRVKDNAAAFAGLEGMVQLNADRRVIVLMEILGRQTPVSLSVKNIEIV